MSGSMVLHCGGQKVSMDDLQRIQLPMVTATYKPVSHYDMALNIYDSALKILAPEGYVFIQHDIGTAKEGQRVFGLLKYRNGGEETGLAIGWRNSYDRSMSAALAIGANVFICDNLAVHGDICIIHKHTKNVEETLIRSIRNALFDATAKYRRFQEIVDRLKSINVTDDTGARLLGLLAFHQVLLPTMFNEAMREWRNSRFEAFQDRNAWSLYNAVTWALKLAPPHRVLEMHRAANDVFVAEYFPDDSTAK